MGDVEAGGHEVETELAADLKNQTVFDPLRIGLIVKSAAN